MKSLTIGIVAEGPTDIELLKELILYILPGDHRFLYLQPDVSQTEGFGAFGAGWKGVLSWCQKVASDEGGIINFIQNVGSKIDLLIIHLDADVSREPEIDCAEPSPPVEPTIKALENIILNKYLNIQSPFHGLICCIPCDNTESWVLCAFDSQLIYHSPPNTYLECAIKPDDIITQRPFKLLKRKDGKPKKSQRIYRDVLIPKIIENWHQIKEICTQAEKFELSLKEFISTTEE